MSYDRFLAELAESKVSKLKVSGNSMLPLIKSGSLLTYQVVPDYEVGDVVFSKVKGRYIPAHKITAKDGNGRYLISNNKGHDNGWTRQIYGKVIAVEPPGN